MKHESHEHPDEVAMAQESHRLSGVKDQYAHIDEIRKLPAHLRPMINVEDTPAWRDPKVAAQFAQRIGAREEKEGRNWNTPETMVISGSHEYARPAFPEHPPEPLTPRNSERLAQSAPGGVTLPVPKARGEDSEGVIRFPGGDVDEDPEEHSSRSVVNMSEKNSTSHIKQAMDSARENSTEGVAAVLHAYPHKDGRRFIFQQATMHQNAVDALYNVL